MAENGDLSYDPGTPEDWLEKVDAWPWNKIGEDKWKKSGPCPRCGHHMARVVSSEVVFPRTLEAEGGSGFGGPIRVLADRVFIECNCASPHKDRPEDESGCGPQGIFDGPREWGNER